LKKNDPFHLSADLDECRMTIWNPSGAAELHSKERKLKVMLGCGHNERLSAWEAKELEDALLMEWCETHQAFHFLDDRSAADGERWVYEMRRP